MAGVFPEPVRRPPQAEVPLQGLHARLLWVEDRHVLFLPFDEDAEIPI